MAQFSNQAQLSYNNSIINSNVAYGEILEVLSATKTAVLGDYTRGDDITYVISAVNSGTTPFTGLTVTDDLGAYAFGAETLYPLSYVEGSVHLYINGLLQPAPTVSTENGLVFSNITLPAGANMLLIYEADANQFAPLGTEDSINNTATITGTGLPTPLTVSETVIPESEPELTITKSIEPIPVAENGTVTYRFVIQNYGNTPAVATDNVSVSDAFDPILSNLTVVFNGETWSEGVEYNYNQGTGLFTTVQSQITVPAATFTQDPVSGAWVVTSGVSVLTVTGTL